MAREMAHKVVMSAGRNENGDLMNEAALKWPWKMSAMLYSSYGNVMYMKSVATKILHFGKTAIKMAHRHNKYFLMARW